MSLNSFSCSAALAVISTQYQKEVVKAKHHLLFFKCSEIDGRNPSLPGATGQELKHC
jgi:hypothetical protein